MDFSIATGQGSRQMRVDVTSDIICPFCLIGVKQLLLAFEAFNASHPSSPISPLIRLLPYQLNPNLPSEPISRVEYKARRFGEEKAKVMTERVRMKMKEVGYEASTEGLTGSSHLAHRLQTYALMRYPDQQLPLAMDIFTAYHVDGHHSSDIDVLSRLAVKHSVFTSEAEAQEWLEGDECDEEVKGAYGVARKMGITGVPFFVFQGKWAASGAMGVEEFITLLEEVVKREGDGSTTPSPTSTMVSPDSAERTTLKGEVMEGAEASEV